MVYVGGRGGGAGPARGLRGRKGGAFSPSSSFAPAAAAAGGTNSPSGLSIFNYGIRDFAQCTVCIAAGETFPGLGIK